MLWEWQAVETWGGKTFHGNQFTPRKMTGNSINPTAVRFPDEAASENPQGCQSLGGTTAVPNTELAPQQILRTFPVSEIPAGVNVVTGEAGTQML